MGYRRARAGCFSILVTTIVMGVSVYFAAQQSGVSVPELFRKGMRDLGGASRLAGVDDRRRVDLDALQTSALALGTERWPDATIVSITAENVYPDGHADLTLGDGGTITLSIGSPTNARDTKLPQGATGTTTAECLDVVVDRTVTFTNTRKFEFCRRAFDAGPVARRPHCSVVELWKRAIAAGAPATDAVASLTYVPTPGPYWHVGIGAFSQTFPDDCKPSR